jgi:hypothetical protein
MIQEQWPELRDALMDLVSTVLGHPDHAMVSFVEFCKVHKAEIDAVTAATD